MLSANRFDDFRPESGVSLDRLFPAATRTGGGGVFATACVTDWREVQEGDVFVALPDETGNGDDGHRHAQRAASCGASAIICEQPVPVFDVPTYLVADSRVALGELCQALMGDPSHSLSVIAVSGTHGKSTTIALLQAIFAAAGKDCGVLSGLGCYDGMSHSRGLSDCPSAQSLADRLSNMEAAGCTHAIVEVSSQMLSQHRLAGIELAGVCVTNVSDAHLELHNTIQSYRQTERRILQHVSPTGVTVLNADDPVSIKWLDRLAGPVLTYGMGGAGEISAKVIECQSNEQTFILSAGNDSVAVRTSLVGEHHVANCLAAATMSLALGIDLQSIARGLESVTRLPGRMERVDCGQGYPLFVDAADTPESLRASLRTARQLAEGRVICVWGQDSDGRGSEHLAISQVLSRLADLAIVTRALPADALETNRVSASVEVVASRSEAIACAIGIAEPGDVVVIAGSRTGQGGSFAVTEDALDDKQLASELLRALPEPVLRLVA